MGKRIVEGMNLTECTCVEAVSDCCASMLAVQGHERRHFEDSAGVHCVIVRALEGTDPQVIYSQLITRSKEMLDSQTEERAALEARALVVAAQRDKFQLLREKRLRKESLDPKEVEYLLDYLLGV